MHDNEAEDDDGYDDDDGDDDDDDEARSGRGFRDPWIDRWTESELGKLMKHSRISDPLTL